MSLSIGNTVVFANSTDVPKKLVDLNFYNIQTPQFTAATPSALQSGKDDSTNQIVCTLKNPLQPATGLGVDIVVNFGPGKTGTAATNAASAYATIVAAATSVS